MACAGDEVVGGGDREWFKVEADAESAKEVPSEQVRSEQLPSEQVPMEGQVKGQEGAVQGQVQGDDWPKYINIGTKRRIDEKNGYYYEMRLVGPEKEVMYELVKGPKENRERGSRYSRGSPSCEENEFLVLRLEKIERDPETKAYDCEWIAYDSKIEFDYSLHLRVPVWRSKDNILVPGQHVWEGNKLVERGLVMWSERGFVCETRVNAEIIDEMREGTPAQLDSAKRLKGE